MKITKIFLFLEGGVSANVECPDGTNIDITVAKEKLTGKTMEERFKAINQRAESFIECWNKSEAFNTDTKAPTFMHPVLNEDFNAGVFPKEGTYTTDINQSTTEPEYYRLSIKWEEGSETSYYDYTSASQALAELTIFQNNFKAKKL